jgi:hypothetical protein
LVLEVRLDVAGGAGMDGSRAVSTENDGYSWVEDKA